MALTALVADDSPIYRELVGTLLGEAGFVCTVVSDGEDLIALGSRSHFDLIVTDLNMEVVDGLTAVSRVRGTQGPCASTPVIVVSGEDQARFSEPLLRLGVEEFLEKPFTVAGLEAAVARALSAPDRSGSAPPTRWTVSRSGCGPAAPIRKS